MTKRDKEVPLGPEPERPRWDDARDITAMTKWVNWHLDRHEFESMRVDLDDPVWDQLASQDAEELYLAERRSPHDPLYFECQAADYGDIKPLRKRLPQLAKYLHAPPRAPHRPKMNHLLPPELPESQDARRTLQDFLAKLPTVQGFVIIRPEDPDPKFRELWAELRKLPPEYQRYLADLRRYEAEQRMFMAAQDVVFIRRLWKRVFKKQNRKTAPSAEEIAADRYEVSVDDLKNYQKKHPRILRRKSRT